MGGGTWTSHVLGYESRSGGFPPRIPSLLGSYALMWTMPGRDSR